MRSEHFTKQGIDAAAGAPRRDSSKIRSRFLGLAVVAALAVLTVACGQETLAEGTATPATIDDSRLNSISGQPADEGLADDFDGDQTVLPDPAKVSDATGAGQQGWVPVVSGPVEPDSDGAYRGSIDSAGQKHVYTFEVSENHNILIDQLGGCETANGDRLNGRLEGPGDSGTVAFKSDADNCFDIDEFNFTGNGTVTFTIEGGDDVTTGSYAFRFVDTTTPAPIAISDGITVAVDSPIAGAGHIEAAGYNDHYQFEVTQGDAFTIQQLGCALDRDESLGVDLDGVEVDGYMSNLGNDCDKVDRFVAQESGTVDMYVGATNRVAGTYSFALNFVNSAQDVAEPIEIGDATAPNAATTYNGTIEELGQVKRYAFDVTQGQRFAIQQTKGCAFIGSSTIYSKVEGAGIDQTTYLRDGDCDDVDRFVAEESGTVTLAVYGPSSETTGSYNFRVLDIPIPEEIRLQSGDVVAPNQPVEGAGSIDAIGGWDRYLIDVEDNQTVTITQTGPCSISDSMTLKVFGETTDETAYLYANRDECFTELVFEAEETTTLAIEVRDVSYSQALGTYGFKIEIS